MALDKIGKRPGGKDHYDRRNDHCHDHDLDMVHHPDRGDHGIQGEDDIEQHDLEDHVPERCPDSCRGVTLLPLQLLVDLMDTLPEQEQSACDQYYITARYIKAKYGK